MTPDIELGATSSDSMKPEHIIDGIRDLVPPKLLAAFDTAFRKDPDSDAVMFIGDDIFDAMDEIAPEGAYFGAHPDDGACFGFWSDEQ